MERMRGKRGRGMFKTELMGMHGTSRQGKQNLLSSWGCWVRCTVGLHSSFAAVQQSGRSARWVGQGCGLWA